MYDLLIIGGGPAGLSAAMTARNRNLSVCVICGGDSFDFSWLRRMGDLECLVVSGGMISHIPYLHLEALLELPHLTELELHEFGAVDLAPLPQMHQLRDFSLRDADQVQNIDAIGSMYFLDALCLDGLSVESLDFLDRLPDTLCIELCGIHVSGDVSVRNWKRFAQRDICEISTGDCRFDYIDLSELD